MGGGKLQILFKIGKRSPLTNEILQFCSLKLLNKHLAMPMNIDMLNYLEDFSSLNILQDLFCCMKRLKKLTGYHYYKIKSCISSMEILAILIFRRNLILNDCLQ
jgi:hypothetical protein